MVWPSSIPTGGGHFFLTPGDYYLPRQLLVEGLRVGVDKAVVVTIYCSLRLRHILLQFYCEFKPRGKLSLIKYTSNGNEKISLKLPFIY
jgi:hypothetical protein